MEPDPPAREHLLRLIDRLFLLAFEAGLAREQYNLARTQQLLGELVRLFEEMHVLLAEADEATRKEVMPRLYEVAAAEGLIRANVQAASRTLPENQTAYGLAIAAAQRTSDAAFVGRARSCYGAVLLYFGEAEDAAIQLQLARQSLRANELGNWVQATRRLAEAYDRLGRQTDGIAVLRETTHVFEAAPYHRPRAVTSHHIEAAVLLARLLARTGQRGVANDLLEQVADRAKSHDTLTDTPEYKRLEILRSIGYWRFERRVQAAGYPLHI